MVYHDALHDRYAEARDAMLMSGTQELIQHADVATQVLYNRAVAQLGMCALRRGNVVDAHAGASLRCCCCLVICSILRRSDRLFLFLLLLLLLLLLFARRNQPCQSCTRRITRNATLGSCWRKAVQLRCYRACCFCECSNEIMFVRRVVVCIVLSRGSASAVLKRSALICAANCHITCTSISICWKHRTSSLHSCSKYERSIYKKKKNIARKKKRGVIC